MHLNQHNCATISENECEYEKDWELFTLKNSCLFSLKNSCLLKGFALLWCHMGLVFIFERVKFAQDNSNMSILSIPPT